MRDRLILLVEDDENDVLLTKLAFGQAGIENPVRVVGDGREALDYFEGAGKYADRQRYPIPYLVLLDLKLPRAQGLEVLRWLRARSQFDSTVVIVLTASSSTQDLAAAYRLNANAYVIKPSGMDQLRALAQAIKDFWLVHNRVAPLVCPSPPRSSPA
jgi:CheY-like chemotaxis protein